MSARHDAAFADNSRNSRAVFFFYINFPVSSIFFFFYSFLSPTSFFFGGVALRGATWQADRNQWQQQIKYIYIYILYCVRVWIHRRGKT